MKTHTSYTLGLALALGLTLQGWSEEAPAPGAAAQVAPDTTAKVSVEGAAGAVSVDGKTYFMIAVRPEFAIEPFGVGLDLRILWNDDGLRKEDWDELRDIANYIRYIRYGKKGDGFYTRLGVLDDTTLGMGFLVNRYSNGISTAFDKTFGAEMMIDMGSYGVEGFSNDVSIFRLSGGRAFIRPLNGSGTPLIEKLEIGGTFVSDRAPGGAVAGLSAYSADMSLPLITGDIFSMKVFGEYARIIDQGWGFTAPGVTGKIGMFNYRAEYISYKANFIPRLFNWNYEGNRPIDWTLPQYSTATNPTVTGWRGEIGWTWENMMSIAAYYESMSGGNPNVHGEAKLLTNLIPKVMSASITYDQTNAKTLTLQDPNTLVTAKAGIEMTPGAILYMTVRQTYDPILVKFIRTTTMETRIKL